MLKKLIIPTTIAAFFVSAPVLGGDVDVKGESQADRNQPTAGSDTAGQPDSASTDRSQSFDDLDTNNDGRLDEEELNVWGSTAAGEEYPNEGAERLLDQYDQNRDGGLSEDEMPTGRFDTADDDMDDDEDM